MQKMFQAIFDTNLADSIYSILSMVLFGDTSSFADASTLIQNVYDQLMKPIAFALLIIYFCVVFVEKTSQEQSTYDQLFLLFAKLVVGVFLIDNVWSILMNFHGFGISMLKQFKTLSTTEASAILNVDDNPMLQEAFKSLTGVEWGEAGLIANAFYWIKAIFSGEAILVLLGYLITKICAGIVYVVCFLRILEVYVRTLFAPISITDIFYNGLNSSGFRFFKSYLAVSLQVVVIYGSSLLHGVLATGLIDIATFDNTTFWGSMVVGSSAVSAMFFIMYIGLTVAYIGLLLKSQSLVKELLGA